MSHFYVQQICVNLTVNFTGPSDAVISLIHPKLHSATVMLTAVWGPLISGEQCPLDSSLQVVLHGQVTTEQWSLTSEAAVWPYNMCQKDMQDVHQWGNRFMPLTHACSEVVQELATLRYYNLSISSSYVSTVITLRKLLIQKKPHALNLCWSCIRSSLPL
jgi:hypothetical protein